MGHLFVAHGDLTKLACDAVLIPCDDKGGSLLRGGVCCHRDCSAMRDLDGFAYPTHPMLMASSDCPTSTSERSGRSLPWHGPPPIQRTSSTRLWHAIKTISAGLPALAGRAVPLVGVPLAGTGEGGLAHRRGEVIDKLLDKHRAQGSSLDCDVALIPYERRDFAAVQARRRPKIGRATCSTGDCVKKRIISAD